MAPHDAVVARCVAVRRRFITPTGPVIAVDDVDLEVGPGSITVISGPSGSGKSTLLGLVACLDRPDAGIVEIGGVEVGDLSYGFLRFLHAAHTARRGAVVLDGGAVYLRTPGENAVLVLGAGKSTLAYRAVESGIQVMADDSLVLDVSSDPPRASCLSGGVIKSRMGFSTSARPRVMRHGRLIAAILIQASFSSAVRVQRASVYDSYSWSWRAVSTRLLNSSCFPNSFEQPYTPQLGQSIERTMIAAHRILTGLPMMHILGDPDGETLPMTLREIEP